MCLNLLLAAVLWRQERAAWQVSPSLQSAGFLPCAHLSRLWWCGGHVLEMVGFLFSVLAPAAPGTAAPLAHTRLSRGGIWGLCSGTLPTTTCNLYSAATIQIHSIPCLRLIKCVLVLDVTCFIKDIDRKDIGEEYKQQIFRYSFYTTLKSKSTSVPPQIFFLPHRLQ